MKLYPQILVTGMGNSGTSFMMELVVNITGLSPGPADGLKKANRHNPRGYWEYIPLRRCVWMASGSNYFVEKIPTRPVSLRNRKHKGKGQAIADMAKEHGVEVFKCVKLPWLYPWFEPRKVVLIRRSALTLYNRYYANKMTLNELRRLHTRYHDLAAKYLDANWDILWTEYENFFTGTEKEIRRVCDYLERPYHKRLLEIFHPRAWRAS